VPDIGRPSLIALARDLTPHLRGDDADVSHFRGGRDEAEARLRQIDPIAYGRTRNHLDGAVTQLSPFITQGVLSLSEVKDAVLNGVEDTKAAEKMVQQLAWRDYWQRLYISLGDGIWDDQEDYKTGFAPSDYADELPDDVVGAQTGVAAIDHFLNELTQTGWLHNHARLYLASYMCHFRRIKWQAGARFFLTPLVGGDPGSNKLAWQWVASTFSHKPYYFNLENLQRFAGDQVDTSYNRNKTLAGSYEDLHLRLFPNLPPIVPQPRKAKR